MISATNNRRIDAVTTGISLRGHVDLGRREKSSRCHSKIITSLESHTTMVYPVYPTDLTVQCSISGSGIIFPKSNAGKWKYERVLMRYELFNVYLFWNCFSLIRIHDRWHNTLWIRMIITSDFFLKHWLNLSSNYCPTVHNHLCSVHLILGSNATAHSLQSPLLVTSLHCTVLDWTLPDPLTPWRPWLPNGLTD
jgi:hypothetical protein